MTGWLPRFDFAPYRLTGTVYGVWLNHAPALAALGPAVHQPPYKSPPQAPVLYLKPRNTLCAAGATIEAPASGLAIGANLGAVIGRTACRVASADAMSVVAGYVIVNDLSVPHQQYFRPSVRFKALDGSCAIASQLVARAAVADPDALAVRIDVDGSTVQRTRTDQRVRPLAQLIADVTEFMTLVPGDILLLGASADAPVAFAGQSVVIEIGGLGRLENRLVAQADIEIAGSV